MKARICPDCGKYNPENAWSCADCGVTLSIETTTQVGPSMQWKSHNQLDEVQTSQRLDPNEQWEISNQREEAQITQCVEHKHQDRVLPYSIVGKNQAGVLGLIFLILSIAGFVNTPENWKLCVLLFIFAIIMLSFVLDIWWIPGTAYAKFADSAESTATIVDRQAVRGELNVTNAELALNLLDGEINMAEHIVFPKTRLIVSFQANQAEGKRVEVQLRMEVAPRLYEELQHRSIIRVKYSRKDPRIALLEGEKAPRYWYGKGKGYKR